MCGVLPEVVLPVLLALELGHEGVRDAVLQEVSFIYTAAIYEVEK